ncbi:hypothetical protein QVD17_29352 [Tagetes erecta]|uniref:Transmembrane protein n=1 Tax=Tagetes erecta TaxID=13708 RepID=A0AAD8KBN2_TARER|nr:hypothetical protein QVD17_29352 [Tagetes erecta]
METPPPHTLNFTGILSTSKRIILSNYIHFVTLSIFFIPLTFTLVLTPTLHHSLSDVSGNPLNHKKLLLFYLLYTLIVNSFSLCSIATITFSTHHVFSGEPIKIIDSVKSLIFSFFPLAFTAIIAYTLTILISLFFLMLVATLLMLAHNIGFVINYNSLHFMWFSAIMSAMLIAIIVYVHVQWSLAFVVVVVESKWGFAALTRSAYLVKGMRLVSLLLMLYCGVFGACIVWICSQQVGVLVLMMLGSYFVMMILLRFVAANTVLYNYCKALHGELVIEVADDHGFDHEYMSLGVGDEKVPRVVDVVAA